MSAWDKISALLASRKFWAMVTSVIAAAAALATNQITSWEFIIAVVAAMAAFSGGVAIEDAGIKIGAGLAAQTPLRVPEAGPALLAPALPCPDPAQLAPTQPTPLQVPEAGPAQRVPFIGADHG